MNRRNYSVLFDLYSYGGMTLFLTGVGIALIIIGLKTDKTKGERKLSLILGPVFTAMGIYTAGAALKLWDLHGLMYIYKYIFPAALIAVGIMLIVKGIKTKRDRYLMIIFGAILIIIGISFFADRELIMIWYLIKYGIPSAMIITGIMLIIKGTKTERNKYPMIILGAVISLIGASLLYVILFDVSFRKILECLFYLLEYAIPSALIITGITLIVKGTKNQRDKYPMMILGSVLTLIGVLLLAVFLSKSIKWLSSLSIVFEILLILAPTAIGITVIRKTLKAEKDRYLGIIPAVLAMFMSISMLMTFLKNHDILTVSYNFFPVTGLIFSAALITGGIILVRKNKTDNKAAGICLIVVGIITAAVSFRLPVYRFIDWFFKLPFWIHRW